MDQRANEPTLREYFSLLYRRKLAVLSVFFITTAGVVVHAYLTPDVYTASTSLIVRFGREFIYRSEVAGVDSSKTFSLGEMVNSEVEILNSRDLARQVVDEIGVGNLYPEVVEKTSDEQTATAIAAAILQDHLSITAVFESSIIRVTFEHTDPKIAADVLNSLVKNFKDKHLKVFGDSKSEFLQGQLDRYRGKLANAETALQTFKDGNRIYQIAAQQEASLSQRAQLETDLRNTRFRITELEHQIKAIEGGTAIPIDAPIPSTIENQRAALMARRNELNSLRETARFRASELAAKYARVRDRKQETKRKKTPISLDPEIRHLRSLDEALIRLLDLELKERDLLRTRKKESRELVTVRAEIELVERFLEERGQQVEQSLRDTIRGEYDTLRARRKTLASQISKIDSELRSLDSQEQSLYLQTLTTELEVLRSKAEVLVSRIAQVDREIAALNSKETELRRLEREVAVNDLSFRGFLVKLEEANTVEELDERKIVNIKVIETATPPVTPSGVSRKVKIAVSGVIGLCAGAAVAFLLELLAH